MVITPLTYVGAAPAAIQALPLYDSQFPGAENVTLPFVLKSPADCPYNPFITSNQKPETSNNFLITCPFSLPQTELTKETVFAIAEIKLSG